jgi:hypothetical protein
MAPVIIGRNALLNRKERGATLGGLAGDQGFQEVGWEPPVAGFRIPVRDEAATETLHGTFKTQKDLTLAPQDRNQNPHGRKRRAQNSLDDARFPVIALLSFCKHYGSRSSGNCRNTQISGLTRFPTENLATAPLE